MRLLMITMSTSPIFYFHRFQTIAFFRFNRHTIDVVIQRVLSLIHYYYILTHPFSINDVLLRDNFALTIMLINDSRAHVGTVQLLVVCLARQQINSKEKTTVVHMTSLWFPFLFLLPFSSVVSLQILLIGDSVDRYIVGDWCWSIGLDGDKSSSNVVWSSHWGASSGLQYGNINSKKQPAFVCGSLLTNDTLAFVHTFGSNPTGPYYEGFTNNKDDLYADTPSRIQRAMEVYYEEYPVPDMIYYNSVQWDLHLLYTTVNDTIALETPHSSLWNESIHNFEKNVNNRLDEIIFHAHRLSLIHGKLANVGIRTAPVNPRPSLLQSPLIAPQNRLILALNNVLRMMARDRNITLYDMDNDIW